VGRAPGTDPRTAQALRRTLQGGVDGFPQDVQELLAYFGDAAPGQPVRAIPGTGSKVPVWMLGSSLYGAQLAAALGLPYAFASHFAPQQLEQAILLYRAQFRPSARNPKPYLMLGLNVVAAENDAEAQRLFTSLQQAFINLRLGQPGPLPPPVDDIAPFLADPRIAAMLQSALSAAVVGSPETAKGGVGDFIARHQPDEIMVTAQVFDHAARKHSFEILKRVLD
jgi:luciferase family oxidoreductase group 1